MTGTKNKVIIPYKKGHKTIEGIEYKLCNKCFEWYKLNSENFYKNKSSPDGFFPSCKQCEKKRALIYLEQNKEKVLKYQKEIVRPRDRKKINDRDRKWRVKNKQHKQQYQLNYQRNNSEIIKKYTKNRKHKNHNITDKQWNNCKKYFMYKCTYCGLPLDEHYVPFNGKIILSDFHREHVDDQGANDLSNCVPSCKSCNSQKWEYSFNEWYNENNNRFTIERYNRIIKWLTDDYKKFL